MRGILVMITNVDEDGNRARHENVTPVDMAAGKGSPPRFGCSAEEALDRVKEMQRADVEFDMGGAGPQEAAVLRGTIVTIEALEWPAQPTGQGHYTLESAYSGGLGDDGVEYRFLPISPPIPPYPG